MNELLDTIQIQTRNAALEEGTELITRNPTNSKYLDSAVEFPVKSKAIEFRRAHLLKDLRADGSFCDYPICSSSLTTIGSYGVGLALYFYLIKSLAILFFLISLISLWPMVENYYGQGLSTSYLQQDFLFLTLANQQGSSYSYNSLEDAESDLPTIQDNQFRYFISDVLYTVCFIVFLVIYRLKSKRFIQETMKSNITAADYTLEFKGFPEFEVDQAALTEHFSQFGEVVEVSVARKYGHLLRFYKERARLSLKLGYYRRLAENRKNVSKKVSSLEQQLARFDVRIAKQEKSSNLIADERPVDRVFVIFSEVSVKKQCFLEYTNSLKWCRRKKNQPLKLKFLGKHPLTCRPATEPSNIYWENIDVTACSRGLRKVVAVLATLLVMACSVGIISYLKSLEGTLPTDKECVELAIPSTQCWEQSYEDQVSEFCCCNQQSWSSLLDNAEVIAFCDEFLDDVGLEAAIRVLGAAAVVAINLVLKSILVLLSRYERMGTRTAEEMKIMWKIFLAMFVNTALVVVLVNADFSGLGFVQHLPFRDYLFTGDFVDFERTWYVSVGTTIALTMVLSMLSPSVFDLLFWNTLDCVKRKCCWRCYRTQYSLNQGYNGEKFSISSRTAVVLVIVFTCFLYSGGIPVLNLVCCVAMTLIYWCDKTLILRYYRKPPLFSHTINDMVLTFLPYAIILHCAVSLYMYGSGNIFPTGFHSSNGVLEADAEVPWARIQRLSGLVNVTLILLTLCVRFWLARITSNLARFVHRTRTSVQDASKARQGSFYEELSFIKQHGLASYNILSNRLYQPLILSMNAAALNIKEFRCIN